MNVSDNILSVIENTPYAIVKGIAERVKERRLESALTQKGRSKKRQRGKKIS
jgi:hypothetical protein